MNLHVKKSNNISRPSFNAEEHQDIKTLTDEARELRCKLDRENNGMQKAKHYLGDIRRSIRHIFVEMEDNIPTIDLCDSIISESPNPTRTAPLNMSSSSNNPRASLQPRAGPSVPPLLRSTSSSSIPARALSGTRNVQVRVGATGTYTTIVTDRTKARPRTTASGASASSRLTSRAPFRNVWKSALKSEKIFHFNSFTHFYLFLFINILQHSLLIFKSNQIKTSCRKLPFIRNWKLWHSSRSFAIILIPPARSENLQCLCNFCKVTNKQSNDLAAAHSAEHRDPSNKRAEKNHWFFTMVIYDMLSITLVLCTERLNIVEYVG